MKNTKNVMLNLCQGQTNVFRFGPVQRGDTGKTEAQRSAQFKELKRTFVSFQDVTLEMKRRDGITFRQEECDRIGLLRVFSNVRLKRAQGLAFVSSEAIYDQRRSQLTGAAHSRLVRATKTYVYGISCADRSLQTGHVARSSHLDLSHTSGWPALHYLFSDRIHLCGEKYIKNYKIVHLFLVSKGTSRRKKNHKISVFYRGAILRSYIYICNTQQTRNLTCSSRVWLQSWIEQTSTSSKPLPVYII